MRHLRTRRILLGTMLGASALLGIGGCESIWERGYTQISTNEFPPTESVTIREVPWERLSDVLEAFRAEVIDSDLHFDDWPLERRAEWDQRIVRALQLTPPERFEVIGRSAFKTTDVISIEDPALRRLATSVGADFAVFAVEFLGTRETVVSEPVFHQGIGISGGYYGHRGWDRGVGLSSGTVWVPVVVEADERAWMVYFVRETGGAWADETGDGPGGGGDF